MHLWAPSEHLQLVHSKHILIPQVKVRPKNLKVHLCFVKLVLSSVMLVEFAVLSFVWTDFIVLAFNLCRAVCIGSALNI